MKAAFSQTGPLTAPLLQIASGCCWQCCIHGYRKWFCVLSGRVGLIITRFTYRISNIIASSERLGVICAGNSNNPEHFDRCAICPLNTSEGLVIESLFISPSVWLCFRTSFAPNSEAFLRIFLRWAHFVSIPDRIALFFQSHKRSVSGFDPDTRRRSTDLLSRALWYFRQRVITVLAGLAYFAMYTLKADDQRELAAEY